MFVKKESSLNLALFGRPVNHSKSPILWSQMVENTHFSLESYQLIQSSDEDFENLLIEEIPRRNAINFTSPFKTQAFDFFSGLNSENYKVEFSEMARLTRACNLVIIHDPNNFSVHNTDAYSFEQIFPYRANSQEKAFFIFGSGPVGRTAYHALTAAGHDQTNLYSFSRTPRSKDTIRYEEYNRTEILQLVSNCAQNSQDICIIDSRPTSQMNDFLKPDELFDQSSGGLTEQNFEWYTLDYSDQGTFNSPKSNEFPLRFLIWQGIEGFRLLTDHKPGQDPDVLLTALTQKT